MNKSFGLKSIAAVGVCLSAFIACDGDDAVTPIVENDAAQETDATTTVDGTAPIPDGGTKVDSGDSGPVIVPGNAARLHIVNDNLITEAGFRFCALATAGTEPTKADVLDSVMFPNKTFPEAAKAGLAAGRVSRAPDLATTYQDKRMRFIAYSVDSLEALGYANLGCTAIAAKSAFANGDAGVQDAGLTDLVEGLDFEVVADFAPNTFKDKTAYALILTGCMKATPSNLRARCANFDGSKNTLELFPIELDNTQAPAGRNSVQVVHASSRCTNLPAPFLNEPKLNFYLEAYYPADAGFDIDTEELAIEDVQYKSSKATPVPPANSPPIKLMDDLYVVLPANNAYAQDSLAGVLKVSEVTMADLKDKAAFTFITIGSPTGDPEVNGQRNYLYQHLVLVPNN